MADRTFTLSEAQGLLPTLSGLLQGAMRQHQEVLAIDSEFQALISRILLSGGVQIDPIRTSRLKMERERGAQKLEDTLGEIAASGAQLKDIEQGLLDFPCVVKGKVILLCWKLGEAAIEHWHGTNEGFANRKPLDPSLYARERLN